MADGSGKLGHRAGRVADHRLGKMAGHDSSERRGTTMLDVESFRGLLAPGRRLIGIDAGTETWGLALSDVTRTIASPLETIRRTKFKEDARRLLAHIEAQGVGGLVLGFPVNLDGSEGPRAQATRALARNLNGLADIA